MGISKWYFFLIQFAYFTIAAIGVVHIGNDNSFYTLLSIPSYYSDLALAFGLSYGFGYYIHWISKRLLNRFSSFQQLKTILYAKFFWGIVPPLLFGALMLACYLYYGLNMALRESSMLYLELPLMALFLAIGNGLHLGAFANKYKMLLENEIKAETTTSDAVPLAALRSQTLIVSSGAQNKLLNVADIAWVIREQKLTFIHTHSGIQYADPRSLDFLFGILGEETFFQVNRQFIANKTAIKGFETTPTRKVQVLIEPAPPEVQYVSKARAGYFTQWLKMPAQLN